MSRPSRIKQASLRVQSALLRQERKLSAAKYRAKKWLGWVDPVRIEAYRGYGNHRHVTLQGRLLEDKPIGGPKQDDPWWRNVINMYRRMNSDEVPDAPCGARFAGIELESATDDEGYFQFRFELDQTSLDRERLWHPVHIELPQPINARQGSVTSQGQVLIPPADSAFGIVSDVDDTIIHSASDLWTLIRITFMHNAATRLPLPGVAEFYQALQAGSEGTRQNPVFYVSSSLWNLYDLLRDFMELNGLPQGPILLRDLGIRAGKPLRGNHQHKVHKIADILETYPHLPFILIGDAGQDDPALYREIVQTHPGRIRAVYIREVPGPRSAGQLAEIAEDIRQGGAEMLLVKNTYLAAEHAAANGWIQPHRLSEVRTAVEKDSATRGSG